MPAPVVSVVPVRAMTEAIPKSSSYFLGSFVSSMIAAFFHVIFGVSVYELHSQVAEFYLAAHPLSERICHQFIYQMGFVFVYAIFIFIVFLLVGYPLFLLLRNTRWFKPWLAIIVGAAVGTLIPFCFNIPIFLGSDFPNYFWICGANGAVSAAVCCWFIHRSNLSFKRDALKRAP